ncbi:GntR family transcriptional regulator [Ruegeria sp.]|uniref:GntR family transcriptional regulator n=1 Tax=Ruegeria sp. TaxID=1879320 RepID=UPI00231C199C|nr:GntR family transcriptional regulator [Ruegeria sp.]MDA7965046.1 GntR family transcriptional regulator [Ruegeria sp.]
MKEFLNYGDGPKAIYEVLKRQIISGELEAGQELKIMPLAKEMDISIVPLREAIRMLAAEKLVELRPRRSPIIARLDVRDLVEMNQIRGALEPIILADAIARHSPETLAECHDILKRTASIKDPWEMVELNKAFHLALLGPSRLKRSLDIIADQYDGIARLTQYRVITHKDQLGKLHDEHALILDAAQSGDVVSATNEMKIHIDQATERARRELGEPHDPALSYGSPVA